MVSLTLLAVDEVAERIERAYRRRYPAWSGTEAVSRVWSMAASALVGLHRENPAFPLDPELFVASQMGRSTRHPDPWQELARDTAVRRYRQQVVRIVRNLRAELREELRRAERHCLGGESLVSVLHSPTKSLTPLARYLVARRAGRPDLAEGFLLAAQDQHHACPLYRVACRGLVPPGGYPVVDILPGLESRRRVGNATFLFSLN